MKTRFLKLLLAASAAAVLAACGGGGDSTPTTTPPTTETPAASKFTQTATWTFNLPAAGVSVCYDFDTKAEVAGCTGTGWDLMVKSGSGGRSAELYTNSGPNGSGTGGAFGSPFAHTWADLQTWKDALVSPTDGAIPANLYFPDSAKSVFTGSNDIQSAAFEYGVGGTHLLYPNYRVFVVTTNSATVTTTAPVQAYSVQLTGYYGGPSGTVSGYPSFRWLDRSTSVVSTATVAATSATDWTYYDLGAKAVSTAGGTWHIAFSRYNVKLNGGASGSGTVAGFLARTPAGFYEADGKTPVAAKFTAGTNLVDTLSDLDGTNGAINGPSSAGNWVKDTVASQLTPAYTGSYLGPMDPAPTALNFGWYSYHPTAGLATAAGLAGAHMLKANPANATLVRSGSGNSYARVHLTSITYAPVVAPAAPYTGTQTWTIEFGIQPAP